MINNKKTIQNLWHLVEISPREVPGEFRIFSENCTKMSNIRGNKIKNKKIFFRIFPKNLVWDPRGPPGGTPPILLICPRSITFCHFWPTDPGGEFWPILANSVFCKFQKNSKMSIIRAFERNLRKNRKLRKMQFWPFLTRRDQKFRLRRKTQKIKSSAIWTSPRSKTENTKKNKFAFSSIARLGGGEVT